MPDSSVWVIIPAYNEEKQIIQILDKFQSYPYHVVVIDDGSTDDTYAQAIRSPVTVLRHIINLGQGAALQTGIDYVVNCEAATYIITFDADGQHNIDDIAVILNKLEEGYDVVLGSRFIQGGKAPNIPALRRLVLKFAILFTRQTTGLHLTDTHNGLRGFRNAAVKALHLQQNRMAHASEILTYIAQQRLNYCEVPVTIHYSNYSLSKGQSVLNGLNILWELINERLK